MSEYVSTAKKVDLKINKLSKDAFNWLSVNNQLNDDQLYMISDDVSFGSAQGGSAQDVVAYEEICNRLSTDGYALTNDYYNKSTSDNRYARLSSSNTFTKNNTFEANTTFNGAKNTFTTITSTSANTTSADISYLIETDTIASSDIKNTGFYVKKSNNKLASISYDSLSTVIYNDVKKNLSDNIKLQTYAAQISDVKTNRSNLSACMTILTNYKSRGDGCSSDSDPFVFKAKCDFYLTMCGTKYYWSPTTYHGNTLHPVPVVCFNINTSDESTDPVYFNVSGTITGYMKNTSTCKFVTKLRSPPVNSGESVNVFGWNPMFTYGDGTWESTTFSFVTYRCLADKIYTLLGVVPSRAMFQFPEYQQWGELNSGASVSIPSSWQTALRCSTRNLDFLLNSLAINQNTNLVAFCKNPTAYCRTLTATS